MGSRKCTPYGLRIAERLASSLARVGLTVVSGLARGIDAAAHEGALSGGTCAVVAGGVDIVYPPENAALHERIAKEGCIVSEMPLGQQPQARHFPRRNRIISGLARGVVVVEAAEGPTRLIARTVNRYDWAALSPLIAALVAPAETVTVLVFGLDVIW